MARVEGRGARQTKHSEWGSMGGYETGEVVGGDGFFLIAKSLAVLKGRSGTGAEMYWKGRPGTGGSGT